MSPSGVNRAGKTPAKLENFAQFASQYFISLFCSFLALPPGFTARLQLLESTTTFDKVGELE